MNLQHLKYFKLACYYQNISKAAQKLHIAQSSLSLAIKSLEKEFGVCLIKRQRVGFALTPEGERFLILADGLLEHAERVNSLMTDEARRHKEIRLGIPPMVGAVMLPTLFSEFSRLHPEVKLSFYEGGRNDLVQQLSENLLDMILTPGDSDSAYEDYNCEDVAEFEDVFCVSTQHPFAQRDSISILDIEDQPLVMFADSFYHNDKILQLFHDAMVEPNILCNTTQLSTMEQLIAKNIAAGFLFKERAEQLPQLKWLHLHPPVIMQIKLVWKKEMHISKDIRLLLEYFLMDNAVGDLEADETDEYVSC